MVLRLLTNPNRFFKREVESPRVLIPAVIVLIIGIISAIASLPMSRLTDSMLSGSAAGLGQILQAFAVVVSIVIPFVAWVLYALVFHAIASVGFDGDGDLKTVFSITGWGFAPQIVNAIIAAVVNYYVLSGVQLPQDPQQAASKLQSLQSQPIFTVLSLLAIAFLLWRAYLWTFGVKHTYDLSLRQAAVTVAVPVGLVVLVHLLGLVLGGL